MAAQRVTTRRASDRAYDALRDDILHWRLTPGTVLGEVEQSTRLGVSRTPLREALARLTADGLVEPQLGRGLVVSETTLDSITQLFETRQALEETAAALAAQRREPGVFEGLSREFENARELLDDPRREAYYDLVRRFDEAMDTACGNAYLVQALGQLRTHLVRIRRLSQDNPERLAQAAGEHQLIAEAVADGDVELARSATRVHLHHSLHTILASADADRLIHTGRQSTDPSTRRTA